MTLDLAELRARLVTGWKPRMDVSIEVATLDALLTELEEARHDIRFGECATCACPFALTKHISTVTDAEWAEYRGETP